MDGTKDPEEFTEELTSAEEKKGTPRKHEYSYNTLPYGGLSCFLTLWECIFLAVNGRGMSVCVSGWSVWG